VELTLGDMLTVEKGSGLDNGDWRADRVVGESARPRGAVAVVQQWSKELPRGGARLRQHHMKENEERRAWHGRMAMVMCCGGAWPRGGVRSSKGRRRRGGVLLVGRWKKCR